ncbi:MAG: hypothetical protein Q9178_007788 [Gyalolechia marmorata]
MAFCTFLGHGGSEPLPRRRSEDRVVKMTRLEERIWISFCRTGCPIATVYDFMSFVEKDWPILGRFLKWKECERAAMKIRIRNMNSSPIKVARLHKTQGLPSYPFCRTFRHLCVIRPRSLSSVRRTSQMPNNSQGACGLPGRSAGALPRRITIPFAQQALNLQSPPKPALKQATYPVYMLKWEKLKAFLEKRFPGYTFQERRDDLDKIAKERDEGPNMPARRSQSPE